MTSHWIIRLTKLKYAATTNVTIVVVVVIIILY